MNSFFRPPVQPFFAKLITISFGVFTAFLLSHTTSAQTTIDHWETVVYDSSTWNYLVPDSALGSSWTEPNFDDSNWQQAKGGFGYGDNDDNTVLSNILVVFIRKTFTINDLGAIESFLLHVDYDDGYIAYLNGIEIGRSNLGSLEYPQFNQGSLELHEAKLYNGLEPESRYFNKEEFTGLLLQGENTISVQVHNTSTGSSDLTARAFLSLGINNSSNSYGLTPEWFVSPVQFESSDLPIIVINTSGAQIPDHTSIIANMGAIDNGIGVRNRLSDPFNNYNGKISIETRGESSQSLPKKII